MANVDPNSCPAHGYNLEWRTCLACDIIKLNAQNSVVNFADITGTFGRPLYPQSATQWSQTAGSTGERRTQHSQQRPTPQVISTTYFSADNPYNFNTGDGRGDHPDRFALTPIDDKFPEDLALSDDENTAVKPRRRRNRLQKRAKVKSRTQAEEDDDDDDMEHLALSDDEDLGPDVRRHRERKYGTDASFSTRKPAARGRHVKFSE